MMALGKEMNSHQPTLQATNGSDVDLANLFHSSSAFLLRGGPSLNSLSVEASWLRDCLEVISQKLAN
jgi:hypothetical protein